MCNCIGYFERFLRVFSLVKLQQGKMSLARSLCQPRTRIAGLAYSPNARLCVAVTVWTWLVQSALAH